jgi:hypothetical protein
MIQLINERKDGMNTTSDNSKAQTGLRTFAFLMIGLLVVQYALGVVTNLYVQFPQTDQIDQLWGAARSQFPAAAHIVIGLLLLVGAVIFVMRAAVKHRWRWIVSSVAGLIAIVVAIYGGVTFVSSQGAAYSLVMAVAFLVAFLAYGWGLYAARG